MGSPVEAKQSRRGSLCVTADRCPWGLIGWVPVRMRPIWGQAGFTYLLRADRVNDGHLAHPLYRAVNSSHDGEHDD